jgi:hypothetical protein
MNEESKIYKVISMFAYLLRRFAILDVRTDFDTGISFPIKNRDHNIVIIDLEA